MQEKVVQNFLFTASTQPSETMDDSKETSSGRLVHAKSHKNNFGIDFACAVRTHSCYIFLSLLLHTIDIYIYMEREIYISPYIYVNIYFPSFVLPNPVYSFKVNLC